MSFKKDYRRLAAWLSG